jgi:hypothetical protein
VLRESGDLGLRRSRALAAVGSDDPDNLAVAVAVAVHGVSPGTRVVVRAGERRAIAESRSLLPLGLTRDVTRFSARYVVCRLRGDRVDGAVADGTRLYTHAGGRFTLGIVGGRDSCTHSGSDPLSSPAAPTVPALEGAASLGSGGHEPR